MKLNRYLLPYTKLTKDFISIKFPEDANNGELNTF